MEYQKEIHVEETDAEEEQVKLFPRFYKLGLDEKSKNSISLKVSVIFSLESFLKTWKTNENFTLKVKFKKKNDKSSKKFYDFNDSLEISSYFLKKFGNQKKFFVRLEDIQVRKK